MTDSRFVRPPAGLSARPKLVLGIVLAVGPAPPLECLGRSPALLNTFLQLMWL